MVTLKVVTFEVVTNEIVTCKVITYEVVTYEVVTYKLAFLISNLHYIKIYIRAVKKSKNLKLRPPA